MGDLAVKLKSVTDQQKADSTGVFVKVKHIVYTVGTFGPFQDDIPDAQGWQTKAQEIMNAQANALRSLGV